MAAPGTANNAQIWTPGSGQDPARYLVDPGFWDESSKQMTPGQLAHARPWLDSGRKVFVWPIGTEGFSRDGQNTIGIHKYLGDQFVDGMLVHRDEARISLSGVFPGIGAQDNMAEFGNVLNDEPPDIGMTLYVPGVFDQVKFVLPENWNFSHDPDDQTHSISYTVSFLVIGEGKRLSDPAGSDPPVNPDQVNVPGSATSSNISRGGRLLESASTDAEVISSFYAATQQGYSVDQGGGSVDQGSSQIGPMEFPVHTPGYSDSEIAAAANAYAADHPGYTPHMLMQEGHIEWHGSTPGVYVKYLPPSSTEWTPIPIHTGTAVAPPAPASQPSAVSSSKTSTGVLTTASGLRTLRTLSSLAYGDPNQWDAVYQQNKTVIDAVANVPRSQIAMFPLPVGIKMAI